MVVVDKKGYYSVVELVTADEMASNAMAAHNERESGTTSPGHRSLMKTVTKQILFFAIAFALGTAFSTMSSTSSRTLEPAAPPHSPPSAPPSAPESLQARCERLEQALRKSRLPTPVDRIFNFKNAVPALMPSSYLIPYLGNGKRPIDLKSTWPKVDNAMRQLRFMHVPKTGGSTIESLGHKSGYPWGRYDSTTGCYWHDGWCLANHFVHNRDVITFCVWRDPVDRIVSELNYWCTSEWVHRMFGTPCFSAAESDAFALDQLEQLVHGQTMARDGGALPGHWGSQESLRCDIRLHMARIQTDFNALMDHAGITDVRLTPANHSNSVASNMLTKEGNATCPDDLQVSCAMCRIILCFAFARRLSHQRAVE